jgi:hypothetical protein
MAASKAVRSVEKLRIKIFYTYVFQLVKLNSYVRFTIIHCHYCIETVMISLTKYMDFYSFHFQKNIFSRQTPK